MAETKDITSLKDTKKNINLNKNVADEEKIYVTFRKYDQYGNDVRTRIDITDLVMKEFNISEKDLGAESGICGNGLYAAAHNFVGLEYINYDETKNKDGHNQPVNRFPVSRWEDRENFRCRYSDLLNASLVNAKQAEAMKRLMDRSFDDFFETTFRRFF